MEKMLRPIGHKHANRPLRWREPIVRITEKPKDHTAEDTGYLAAVRSTAFAQETPRPSYFTE